MEHTPMRVTTSDLTAKLSQYPSDTRVYVELPNGDLADPDVLAYTLNRPTFLVLEANKTDRDLAIVDKWLRENANSAAIRELYESILNTPADYKDASDSHRLQMLSNIHRDLIGDPLTESDFPATANSSTNE